MPQSRRALPRSEKLDWLRLIRSENVGPITFFRLLERYGSAAAARAALPDLARRGGRAKPLRIARKADAEAELAALDALGARLIAACEPDYPEALAAIDDAPPVVTALGHPHLARRRPIAVVGARNASLGARKLAEGIARDLGEAGCTVVSGLARGIDAAAHAGSLATGTVAVIAGGIDSFYPEENRALQERIAAEGLVLAEQPPGTQPQARHFPRRNRIIAGLSLGVLVVEAARRSGSLITARLATEYGREVFAVPGSPLDPRAQGPNDLLRQGAILTESARDVLTALDGVLRPPLAERRRDGYGAALPGAGDEAELARARRVLLECLSPTPVTVDELIRGCQLSAAVVLTALLELELAGRVERQPGNRVNLSHPDPAPDHP